MLTLGNKRHFTNNLTNPLHIGPKHFQHNISSSTFTNYERNSSDVRITSRRGTQLLNSATYTNLNNRKTGNLKDVPYHLYQALNSLKNIHALSCMDVSFLGTPYLILTK